MEELSEEQKDYFINSRDAYIAEMACQASNFVDAWIGRLPLSTERRESFTAQAIVSISYLHGICDMAQRFDGILGLEEPSDG